MPRPVYCHQTKKTYLKAIDAGYELRVASASISRCANGNLEKAGGYTFRDPTPAELKAALKAAAQKKAAT